MLESTPELSYELVPPWVYAFSKLNNGEVEIVEITHPRVTGMARPDQAIDKLDLSSAVRPFCGLVSLHTAHERTQRRTSSVMFGHQTCEETFASVSSRLGWPPIKALS